MKHSFSSEVNSELFRQLLQQDLGQLQRANDDLEISGCQHSGNMAGDCRDVQNFAEEILGRVVGHAEEGLNAVVADTGPSRRRVNLVGQTALVYAPVTIKISIKKVTQRFYRHCI